MSAPGYREDLAYIHHHGFGGLARGAAPWLIGRLAAAGLRGGTVVELGCGGGVLLAALASAGYRPVGVDSSAAMLALAAANAPAAALRRGSLYEAPIPECVAVVAVGEPLSYVGGPGETPDTARLFERIHAALPRRGLLVFDVLVRDAGRAAADRNWTAGEDWACLFEVAPHSGGRFLRRAITTFRRVDGAWRRGREEHWVCRFSTPVLRRELEGAGFRVATAAGYGRCRLAPGRRLFLCRKL